MYFHCDPLPLLSLVFDLLLILSRTCDVQSTFFSFTAVTSLSFGSLVPVENVTVSSAGLPDAVIGLPYGPVSVPIAGALPPFTVVLSGGVLPVGITMTTSGQLSGVASELGGWEFEVSVRARSVCERTIQPRRASNL